MDRYLFSIKFQHSDMQHFQKGTPTQVFPVDIVNFLGTVFL